MELTEENIKEIANLNSGQYVLLRNSKAVTVVPVCYLAGEIIKLKKRIAELEAENDRLVDNWISPVLAGVMSEKTAKLEAEITDLEGQIERLQGGEL